MTTRVRSSMYVTDNTVISQVRKLYISEKGQLYMIIFTGMIFILLELGDRYADLTPT